MSTDKLPLEEKSISELYLTSKEKVIYKIPIYQRNYAWGEDEIRTLVKDIYDTYINENRKGIPYYIGTLVTYKRGDNAFEVIDGQQRLTTIYILLKALKITGIKNELTYNSRTQSAETLKKLDTITEDYDKGIKKGLEYAQSAVDEYVPKNKLSSYIDYFKNNVHIIHYQVPKDVDLNHYFEVMNSRGEQLEKHEIVKSRLCNQLDPASMGKFSKIWEACSRMENYIQQNYKADKVFSDDLTKLCAESFDSLPEESSNSKKSINALLKETIGKQKIKTDDIDKSDSFQPIIDFPNFLLIVLKITRMSEPGFVAKDFILDDKELVNEFDKAKGDAQFVKKFAFNLLKARYFLDNYIVHHTNEEDSADENPWKLQVYTKKDRSYHAQNLWTDQQKDIQEEMTHLLSMFEVSFTPKNRKNYLFYCLYFLMNNDSLSDYYSFVKNLADKYFFDVYLVPGRLSDVNVPLPGAFDEAIISGDQLCVERANQNVDFVGIYGDGTKKTKGVPLFVFNYLDYKIWKKYADNIKGEKLKEGSRERKDFFEYLGCSDFGLKRFSQFYFSRTRRSLEHYFPQAHVRKPDALLNEDQINCLGNFAMIGSEANSSGSDWSPMTKRQHYLDNSKKINPITVASLKFFIMLQKCKDNSSIREGDEWNFDDIKEHQRNMMKLLNV